VASSADTSVVKEEQEEPRRRATRGHGPFAAVVGLAVLLRLAVVLGYPPILYFNDSYYYLNDAVHHLPDNIRPDGYPFFLDLLGPLHSLTAVSVAQSLMGVAMGVAIYALLRHRALPWWGATLCSLPVLFGEYELLLEHMLGSDTLFIFLVTIAVIALCWSAPRPPGTSPAWKTVIIAGLLVGYSVTVRSVGEPLMVIVAIAMLVGGIGWRKTGAFVLAWAIPVLGYVLWFHAETGAFSLGGATGTFLYGRVSSFAECSKMDPPADIKVLCDPRPPSHRPGAESYIWDGGTPLAKLTGPNSNLRFTKSVSSLAMKFAERAIEKQPLSYVAVVTHDTLSTFSWKITPSDEEGSGPTFQFGTTPTAIPYWASDYPGNASAQQMYASRETYTGEHGASAGATRVVSPWASFVREYAKIFVFRGPLLGLVLLIGLMGLLWSAGLWRVGNRLWGLPERPGGWRAGRVALLPWVVAALLIVLPPATAGFSYRYVAAAVPLACLAAGLAFARPPSTAPSTKGTGDTPAPL
jgi:hypothetical protein